MNYQGKIRIGPLVFEVVDVERLMDKGEVAIWGNVDMGEVKIKVEKRNGAQQKILTVMHEIVHVILHQAGHKELAENEGLIEAISYGIAQVIVDNTWFVNLLLGEFQNALEGSGNG